MGSVLCLMILSKNDEKQTFEQEKNRRTGSISIRIGKKTIYNESITCVSFRSVVNKDSNIHVPMKHTSQDTS